MKLMASGVTFSAAIARSPSFSRSSSSTMTTKRPWRKLLDRLLDAGEGGLRRHAGSGRRAVAARGRGIIGQTARDRLAIPHPAAVESPPGRLCDLSSRVGWSRREGGMGNLSDLRTRLASVPHAGAGPPAGDRARDRAQRRVPGLRRRAAEPRRGHLLAEVGLAVVAHAAALRARRGAADSRARGGGDGRRPQRAAGPDLPDPPGRVPGGADPHRDVSCHCALGSIHQVLAACGVDVDRALPWIRPWFVRYQMADGGLNCDPTPTCGPTSARARWSPPSRRSRRCCGGATGRPRSARSSSARRAS